LEEYNFDCPGYLDRLLRKIISSLLKEEKDQKDLSHLDKSKELLVGTPPKAQYIMQDALRIFTYV